MPSADNLCKQFGSRSGPTKCRAWSGSKLFDTLMVFLKEFFEKEDFEKNQKTTQKHTKLPSMTWRQFTTRINLKASCEMCSRRHLKDCIASFTACWAISCAFLSSADFFFKINFFEKKIRKTECQTVWIQIMPDIFSGLIWVQTFCNCYQQTGLVGTE